MCFCPWRLFLLCVSVPGDCFYYVFLFLKIVCFNYVFLSLEIVFIMCFCPWRLFLLCVSVPGDCFYYVFLSLEIVFIMCFCPCLPADPDEVQHYDAFHLNLHCLQKYPFWGFQYAKG